MGRARLCGHGDLPQSRWPAATRVRGSGPARWCGRVPIGGRCATPTSSVNTDGCYSATVSGESLGGPTLRTPDGRSVRNLLYAFEGCFDTT